MAEKKEINMMQLMGLGLGIKQLVDATPGGISSLLKINPPVEEPNGWSNLSIQMHPQMAALVGLALLEVMPKLAAPQA